jgi:hypothetical protein
VKIILDLKQEIKAAQMGDTGFQEFRKKMLEKGSSNFKEREDAYFAFGSVSAC